MKTRITIKKYVMDETISWEERYKQLEAHHKEETEFLIRRIESLEEFVDEITNEILDPEE